MEEIIVCPLCHIAVRPSDFFCYNCGKNLHPTPPSTTQATQIQLYLGSLLLPPMGIIWSLKYLKSPDKKSQTIGIVLVAITVIVIIITTKFTVNAYNAAMSQVDQIQNLQGF